MFFPESRIRVFLYGQPTDMRNSFDGLQALTRHVMDRDPLDGSLYVFVNRRGAQVRVLYFDRSGFCVWAKRLQTGRFISWRDVHTRRGERARAEVGTRGPFPRRYWCVRTPVRNRF